MSRMRLIVSIAALVAALSVSARAYVTWGTWQAGPIIMNLQLEPSPGPLDDGCGDWRCVATNALIAWNLYLDRVRFGVGTNQNVPPSFPNGANDVFWSDTMYGDTFGDGTLGVTIRHPVPNQNNEFGETDVLFNRNYRWNSYDGPIRWSDTGGVWDFERVAIHEFGHVLGLTHPDEAGQYVDAIMNSTISDRDSLAFDDIRGAFALYAPKSVAARLPFPPRNDTLDFRTVLERKYRDGFRRAQGLSFADPEGAVVWTQEYMRYRLHQCRHDQASARVVVQIDGNGVQPVCGTVTGFFPPRDEVLRFRLELETLYRDRLARSMTPTYVDLEGEVIWVSEYLRYRLSGCRHQTAMERTIWQVDGGGVSAACS